MPNQQQATNQWIDRYVAEVGRLLPTAMRADVELEIRSLIEEEVGARTDGAANAGDDLVLDVLRSFGPPHEIAARYGAQQYLIGPALYPTFITVLRVVVALALLLNLIAQAIAIGVDGAWPGVADTLGNLYTAVITAAGTVVLVFALVERFSRAEIEKAMAAGPWDPRSLPVVEDGERVKVGETIFEVVLTLVFLLALNIFFDGIGPYLIPGTDWEPIPIFSDAFPQFIPWLSLWLLLDLLVSIVALARGRWSAWLRWAKLGAQAVGIGVLIWMLTGPPLAAWPVLETSYRITIALILAFTIYDAGKEVLALASRRARRPEPASMTPTATQ